MEERRLAVMVAAGVGKKMESEGKVDYKSSGAGSQKVIQSGLMHTALLFKYHKPRRNRCDVGHAAALSYEARERSM